MVEKQSKRAEGKRNSTLFSRLERRRHRHLFLSSELAKAAGLLPVSAAEFERVSGVLKGWAELAKQDGLKRKETELDAEFLQKIFGEALNYKSVSESPTAYQREKNPSVPDAGIADGALGNFVSGQKIPPTAIIELKGEDTDLDYDKFNGRSPVQQCWDYLNNLPDTQWGIVSNYVSIRLYHKSLTQSEYEEFTVSDFLDPERV